LNALFIPFKFIYYLPIIELLLGIVFGFDAYPFISNYLIFSDFVLPKSRLIFYSLAKWRFFSVRGLKFLNFSKKAPNPPFCQSAVSFSLFFLIYSNMDLLFFLLCDLKIRELSMYQYNRRFAAVIRNMR